MRITTQRITPLLVGAFACAMLTDVWATCGGGGGGGTGGMSGTGAMGTEEVYPVPWKDAAAELSLRPGALVVYWIPASQTEYEKSSLRNSRTLSLYASGCITMGVAGQGTSIKETFAPASTPPVAVLAQADGKVLGKAEGKNGFLRVAEVEKLVDTEMKSRENGLKLKIKTAKDLVKAGKKDDAIAAYRDVVGEQCLFPNQAKDAVSELKKLGVGGLAAVAAGPIMDASKGASVERALKTGLMFENTSKFADAERLYTQAHRLDPADPAPMRYLGELYRHHTGDWDHARQIFTALLDMRADPLSRAVALHGLGKMTIHDGDFKKGLGLMEDSVKEFPLALAYRNLAVYWHSEGDLAKADAYTKQALALDPKDPFNLVFAAAFLAGQGQADAALAVAREHDGLLCASYDLAAIYAQAGQKDRALALLKRHFFEYERTDSVRSKEMMEARVDAVFASIVADKEFLDLTAGADGKLPMRARH